MSERSLERAENNWLLLHIAIAIIATFSSVTVLLWLLTRLISFPLGEPLQRSSARAGRERSRIAENDPQSSSLPPPTKIHYRICCRRIRKAKGWLESRVGQATARSQVYRSGRAL